MERTSDVVESGLDDIQVLLSERLGNRDDRNQLRMNQKPGAK